ncbi:MAG: hypothetical protein AAGC71_18790, partial [Pseudomonadota bacterium]
MRTIRNRRQPEPHLWQRLRLALALTQQATLVLALAGLAIAWTNAADAQTRTADQYYPALHALTRAELDQINTTDPLTDLRVELAYLRSLINSDISAATERLPALESRIDAEFYPSESVYLHSIKAELLIRSGKLDEASAIIDEHRAALAAVDEPSVRVVFMLAEGLLLVRYGQQDRAIALYRRARFIAQSAGDSALTAIARHNEGVAQIQLGLTVVALENLTYVANNIDLIPNDMRLEETVRFNLAYLQLQSGEYQAALSNLQAVDRAAWIELGHETRAFIVTTQLARAYSSLARHNDAVTELEPWLQRADVNPGPDLMNDARTVLAEAYLALGDYEAAERYIRQARAQIEASDAVGKRAEFDVLEASLARARGDLSGARDKLAETIARLSQGDPSKGYLDALHLQADVYNELGDYAAAYAAQRSALQVERVLRTADFDRRMSVAIVTSEKETSQRELDMLRAGERLAQTRSERDRIFDIALIGIGILLVLIAYLIWLQWHREHAARTRLEKTVAERTEQVRQELERRVDAERAKRLLEHRLVEDEKYRAVARLTGGLAHDFNNLMTVVSCSAELIKLGAEESDIDALAEDILDAADSGTRVTRSLIAYARQQALQPEQLQLDEFLIDNEALIRNTLGESIELTLDLAPARVEIDRASLTTALLNVLF